MKLEWKPDKQAQLPLYAQIVAFIRGKIQAGEWPVGSPLPTQRTLARELGVNRSTVIAALEECKAEGLLEAVEGSRTIVRARSWADAVTRPPDWQAYVEAGAHPPNLPTIQEINRTETEESIIRLGTGELSTELLPVKQMQMIYQRLAEKELNLGYLEPKGFYPLREQISIYLQSFGINVSPASILIVSGALQALQLISQGLLRMGSTIFVEKPSYLYSLHVFQSMQMKLFGIPLDHEGPQTEWIHRYQPVENPALLYTIPTFHNPTGTLMSPHRRRDLLQLCEQKRLPILEDDVYRELWLEEPAPAPLKAMDQHGLVLYMGSMSKSVSPGLRIGWIVGPQPVIDRLADLKMQMDYGASTPSQSLAAEWFAGGYYQTFLAELRPALRARRDLMLALLAKHYRELGTWEKPRGGFYIWLQLYEPVSMRHLFEIARQRGILLNPGHVYERGNHQALRLSYAYASPKDIETSMVTLAGLIRQAQG